MRRAYSVEIDHVVLHTTWYGCELTGQGGRSSRLTPRSVSRGLGVRPTIVGLVLRRQTFYPQKVQREGENLYFHTSVTFELLGYKRKTMRQSIGRPAPVPNPMSFSFGTQ